jgi:hypothetical protein
MVFSIIPSMDGDGFSRLEKATTMLRDSETRNQISLEANRRFQDAIRELEPDRLICTLHFGVDDHRQYRLFEIKDDTAIIALPDMVMQEVPKTSLYDPDVCEDILWEKVDADLRNQSGS